MTEVKGRSSPAIGEWGKPSWENKMSNDHWRDNEYEIIPIPDRIEYEIPPIPDRIAQREQKREEATWEERRNDWWAKETTIWGGAEWEGYYISTW